MAKENLSSKAQAWFYSTGLPSDIVIEVEEINFHLHKFPLMSRSKKLYALITEKESNFGRRRSSSKDDKLKNKEGSEEEEEDDEEPEEQHCHIGLPNFPGGSETFETAAKFCYGKKIDLTPSNVAALRCAGEFLEMTDDYSEDNLISKTERFLTQSVLRNFKESLNTLKSCENLFPFAETLSIPKRCIDSITTKASSLDDQSLFGWPVNNEVSEDSKVSNPILWNGIDTGIRQKNLAKSGTDSLFDNLTILSLPLYKRLISAMKDRELSSEIIEQSLVAYAKRFISGLSRSTRKQSSISIAASESEQRELVETLITNLPLKKRSPLSSMSSMTTRFLFGLLKTANILNASEDCRDALERKIGSQLEQATLDDLLLPSYSYRIETLYDVDCVERILGYFLEELDEKLAIIGGEDGEEVRSPAINPVMLVGKLVDGYLSEIASDGNLKPEKFCDLAVALPDHARLFDDALYRAVDVYLKAHPRISEQDREKICGVMDCQKLTLDACTHAAQNERLPLRSIVQVLFFEQLQLRRAIAGSLLAADAAPSDRAGPSLIKDVALGHNDTWQTTVRENQVLRLDMDSMRSRVYELERECSVMRKDIQKIDISNGWRSFTKRFGCKFKTQVCDSTVVQGRKDR